MAAKCTVIAADHPKSAANEVIADAGFLVAPTVDALTETLSWKFVTPDRCSDI